LKEQKNNFEKSEIKNIEKDISIENGEAFVSEKISVLDPTNKNISVIDYDEFLEKISQELNINIKTLHQAFIKSKFNINQYLSIATIRLMKKKFADYLMYNAIDKFSIEYQKVSNEIHPTKFTDKKGKILKKINASDIGILNSDSKVAENYFLEELFYDSDLERKNIKESIEDVVVFTKIPKNSIKIPVAGGKTYSPDFAYVLNFKDKKKKLCFIVETKNVEGNDFLRKEEKRKIKHAEEFFGKTIKIRFKTQFSNDKMTKLIFGITKKI
jgi:type III restriction enzyme